MSYVTNVYGVFLSPEDIEQQKHDKEHGIVRFHETTYLEYSIPVELEEKLSMMIQKEVNKFEEKCKCEDCKNRRKSKK